ncbi:MAG: serine proteinase [Hyphomicrobiales bacterium]|nr:serine proteinase [Hyphomicrobiales bacterium]
MFFKSCPTIEARDGFSSRNIAGHAALRQALLVGTILGAGALVVAPRTTQAADIVQTVTTPRTSQLLLETGGTDAISVTTSGSGTFSVSNNQALLLVTLNGAATVTANTDIAGDYAAVYFTQRADGTGASTLSGSGNLSSSYMYGNTIVASGTASSVTLGGTGTTTANGAQSAAIMTNMYGPSTVLINRSGALTQLGQGTGIYAHTQGGSVTIESIGSIDSEGLGIDAGGNNETTINIGGAAGLTGAIKTATSGITASTGGTINIKTASGGTLTTGGAGITTNAVSNETNITVGAAIESTGGDAAITATSEDGKITVTANAAVTGAARGVNVESTGRGAVLVTGSGAIKGDLGMSAYSRLGNVEISGTGATTARSGHAIYASAATGDILITRSGTILAQGQGGGAGVYASTESNGSITIKNLGQVTATAGSGIFAETTGSVDIGGLGGLANAVSGTQGISATGAGVTIKTTAGGEVTGTSSAIVTNAGYGATTITLGAAVAGGTIGQEGGFSEGGVFAQASGYGAITITSTAAISTLSNNATGIIAITQGGDIDIGGAAGLSGAVSGATGIYAETINTGAITIKTVSGGTVTGTGFMGLEAYTVNGALTLDVGDVVRGGSYGIFARSTGSGDITIKSTARIAGVQTSISSGVVTEQTTSGYGIYAITATSSVNIGGTAGLSGAVSGETGIYANTSGAGAIAIKTVSGGKVTGTGNIGLEAYTFDGALTLDVGDVVRGGNYGIFAQSTGSGDITIKSTSRFAGVKTSMSSGVVTEQATSG